MPIDPNIDKKPYDQFRLDAKNPRLGREHTKKDLSRGPDPPNYGELDVGRTRCLIS